MCNRCRTKACAHPFNPSFVTPIQIQIALFLGQERVDDSDGAEDRETMVLHWGEYEDGVRYRPLAYKEWKIKMTRKRIDRYHCRRNTLKSLVAHENTLWNEETDREKEKRR